MTASDERINLKPGDYIATADLSEDDYHNVARAFMAAGACRGEYPNLGYFQIYEDFGWSGFKDSCYHQGRDSGVRGYFKGRQLTLSQILNATNAGNNTQTESTAETTPIHLTDRLGAAIRAQAEANAEAERLQADWRAVYPGISGCVDIDVEDIKPEDWRVGDIVECTANHLSYISKGNHYELTRGADFFKDIELRDDNGDLSEYNLSNFKFIRRP